MTKQGSGPVQGIGIPLLMSLPYGVYAMRNIILDCIPAWLLLAVLFPLFLEYGNEIIEALK